MTTSSMQQQGTEHRMTLQWAFERRRDRTRDLRRSKNHGFWGGGGGLALLGRVDSLQLGGGGGEGREGCACLFAGGHAGNRDIITSGAWSMVLSFMREVCRS